MGASDDKLHRFALVARRLITVYIPSLGTGVGNSIYAKVAPYQGIPVSQAIFGWEIVAAQCTCKAVTATAQVQVQGLQTGGGLTNFISPVAAAVTNMPIVATPQQCRGGINGDFAVRVLSDGTGTLTDCYVTVTVKPYPLLNEAA